MLSYSDLLNLRLGSLKAAVDDWSAMVTKLQELDEGARSMDGKSKKSDWSGVNSEVTKPFISKTAGEFTDAATQAASIRNVLRDAYTRLSTHKKNLRTLVNNAPHDNLTVRSDGSVSTTETASDVDKSKVEGLVSAITTVLEAATEDDRAAVTALHSLNRDAYDFQSVSYTSLADAEMELKEKGTAQAEKFISLAKKQGDLTNTELSQLNKILVAGNGNPYFAERVATGLGPRGTLELWQQISTRWHPGVAGNAEERKERGDAVQRLNKSLGNTLSIATQSTTAAMKQWEQEIIALGQEKIRYTNQHGGRPEGVYGFQVMSSLLRNGEYDTDFLGSYGENLISFEKSHDLTPKELWMSGPKVSLNYAGSDAGNDPMVGFMESLGHNPEAAKELLFEKQWDPGEEISEVEDKVDRDLKYLLIDREWPDDSVIGQDAEKGFGYDELGHALEAATLGVPYDQPEAGLKRDDASANIMEQVALIAGQDPAFIDDRPGIGNSLSKMGAGYIDDLDWSLRGFGQRENDAELRQQTFHHTGPGHANLTHQQTINFLDLVGRSEEGYETLSSAQRAFSINTLKSQPDDDSVGILVETGAKMHGVLDEARVSEISEHYDEKSEEYERKLAESAEWNKFVFSQGLGGAAALATLPFAGPGGSAVVAFAVPMVIDGIASAAETQFGIDLDRKLEEQAADFTHAEKMKKSAFTEQGQANAMDPVDAYLDVTGRKGTPFADKLNERAENGYVNGSLEANQTDTD